MHEFHACTRVLFECTCISISITAVPNDFPVITEHPNMKVVASRHDAVFYCEAVGTDNALIQWYVDGFPIQPSDKYDFVEGTCAYIHITITVSP